MFKTLFIKLQNSKISVLGGFVYGGKNSRISDSSGQSLIEILIALAIGALMIGAASIGVAFMLRSTSTNQNLQSASGFMQEIVNKTRSFAGASWHDLYGLTKGADTHYFLSPSSTVLFAVEGKQGGFDNDVGSGLLGKWGFDEATGTIVYDETGSNNNGTMYDNPTRATSTCETGYCLDFNGNSYVKMLSSGNFLFSGDFTISFWENASGSARQHAFSLGNSAFSNNLDFDFNDTAGVSAYWNGSGSNNIQAGATGDYTDAKWHHILLTRNSSTLDLFIDGVSVGTSTYAGDIGTAGDTLTIGKLNSSSSYYWSGSIDEVRVYGRSLSSDEVYQLYNSRPFSRYFSVEDVCRTNDASSTISGVAPCGSGSFQDPSTEKITVTVEWISNGSTASTQTSDYITRWKNDVFEQTDWSGASGSDGPYTEPESVFSTSSNVDTNTQGTIRIHNL